MIRIELLTWEQAQPITGPIRFASFVEEPEGTGFDLDDKDAQCVHAVAYDPSGKAVGTGRLLPEGQIGRLAVLKDWRRRGVGDAILEALTGEARKRGLAEVVLSAPLRAAEFYRSHGFTAEGKVYKEADVLHQAMRKSLLPGP